MAAGNDKDSGFGLLPFDFTSEVKVLTALSLIPKDQRAAFLLKFRQKNEKAFLRLLNCNVQLRCLTLDGLSVIFPNEIISSLKVARKVVNNPRIPDHSIKTFAVCEFTEEAIFRFTRTALEKQFG